MTKLSSILFLVTVAMAQLVAAQDSLHLYLIRGIGRESGHWGDAFLQQVHQNYPHSQIHFLDLPGAGQYFDQPALMSIPKMARFLEESYGKEIEKYTGNAVLLATSLAGNVALEWTLQQPQRFSGLILVGTSLKKICQKKDRVQPSAKKEFFDIFLTNDVKEREERFLAINSNHHIGNDSLLAAWVNIQKERPVKRISLAKQTLAGALYQAPRQAPPLPILIIGSEKDKIVTPACICAVQKHLNARLAMHDSSGHGLPIDAPIWLADQISYWANEDLSSSTETWKDSSSLLASRELRWEERQIQWVQRNMREIGRSTEKTVDAALFWEKD